MKAQELPETFSLNKLVEELKRNKNRPVYVFVVNEKDENGETGGLFEIRSIGINSEFVEIIIEDLK